VKERPILFTPANAQLVHTSQKTQTRRLNRLDEINTDPASWDVTLLSSGAAVFTTRPRVAYWHREILCPFGVVGDRLWIRESFYIDYFEFVNGPLPKEKPDLDDGMLIYRGAGTCCQQFAECECGGKGAPWRPSLHMPRWACRTVVEITEIRVERLNAISEADARAEGCEIPSVMYPDVPLDTYLCVPKFQKLWESIHGPESWALNPWVWCITFKKIEAWCRRDDSMAVLDRTP